MNITNFPDIIISYFININIKIIKNKNVFLFLTRNIKFKKLEEKLDDITIINLGSICEGDFAILILERDNNQTWKIQTINYLTI